MPPPLWNVNTLPLITAPRGLTETSPHEDAWFSRSPLKLQDSMSMTASWRVNKHAARIQDEHVSLSRVIVQLFITIFPTLTSTADLNSVEGFMKSTVSSTAGNPSDFSVGWGQRLKGFIIILHKMGIGDFLWNSFEHKSKPYHYALFCWSFESYSEARVVYRNDSDFPTPFLRHESETRNSSVNLLTLYWETQSNSHW